jgi:glycine betaine/proline transport system substrate-binding protein
MTSQRRAVRLFAAGLAITGLLAACGSDSGSEDSGSSDTEAEPVGTDAAAPATDAGAALPAGTGEGIVLAVNPWTGSAVNAQVAKVVLEAQLGTPVEILEIDENATWVGLDDGSIDAVLEVWPSGHSADYETYVTGKQSVVDLGPLGPSAKIGWYVPSFVVEEHPELATWEGFKDPELAGLFATAESGDLGQFLMGDPSYVTYDEQIIANLELPLKYVVAGSEAGLITSIQNAVAEKTPLLLQFWQPHWLQSQVELTEVKLPEVTQECLDSAAAADGTYACDYPVDELYKAASAQLEEKNPAAFTFLANMQLTTDQQNEIAAMIDSDGMAPDAAAKAWVDANADIVTAWLG